MEFAPNKTVDMQYLVFRQCRPKAYTRISEPNFLFIAFLNQSSIDEKLMIIKTNYFGVLRSS